MVRGLYTAATGMMVQRNKMDVLTNNIVNAETTGFKSDTLVSSAFSTKMLQLLNDPNAKLVGSEVGGYNFGTHIQELFTDFTSTERCPISVLSSPRPKPVMLFIINYNLVIFEPYPQCLMLESNAKNYS